MTERKLTNLPASVRQRLLNIARDTGRPFQELVQYYAMERFLYRLSRSPYADRFVLKGALMLPVWEAPVSRPTRDIDLLGHLNRQLDYLIDVIREICRQDVEPDGIVFDCDHIEGEEIREAATRMAAHGDPGRGSAAMLSPCAQTPSHLRSSCGLLIAGRLEIIDSRNRPVRRVQLLQDAPACLTMFSLASHRFDKSCVPVLVSFLKP